MRPTVCLACRSRKVKCIRPEGSPEQPCEFCLGLGLACQTAPRHRPGPKPTAKRPLDNPAFSRGKHKRGRRIVALIEQQQQSAPAPSPAGTRVSPRPSLQPAQQGSTSAALPSPTSPAITPLQPPPAPRASSRYEYGDELNVLPAVEGLTRAALDACVEAFLTIPGRIFHLSLTPSEFMRRYEYLACLSFGQPVPPHLVDPQPHRISPLLVLSVAARGAPFVDEYQHLMGPLSDYCAMLAVEPFRLAKDGADAVESIYLFSQGTHSSYARSSDGLEDPLKRDPLGRRFAVDLALFHKLNEVPAPGSIDEEELRRRRYLFYIIFVYDALSSAASGRMYRIASEDVGWPMDMQSLRLHPWAVLMLGARRICREALSPKARVKLTLSEAHDLLDALYVITLHLGTKPDLAQDEQAWNAARSVPLPADKFRGSKDRLLLTEQIALLTVWNWLYLVLWIAFTRNPSLRQSSVGTRAAEEAYKATERMGQLASRALRDGDLLPQMPRLVRDHLASFALWIWRILCRTTQTPSTVITDQPNVFLHDMADTPLDPPETENQGSKPAFHQAQLKSIAATLIEAVRAIRVPPDSNKLADVLQDMINRASSAHRPVPPGQDGASRTEGAVRTSEGLKMAPAALVPDPAPDTWREDFIAPLLAGGPAASASAAASTSATVPATASATAPLLFSNETDPLFSFGLDLAPLDYYDPIWSPELLSILSTGGRGGAFGA